MLRGNLFDAVTVFSVNKQLLCLISHSSFHIQYEAGMNSGAENNALCLKTDGTVSVQAQW